MKFTSASPTTIKLNDVVPSDLSNKLILVDTILTVVIVRLANSVYFNIYYVTYYSGFSMSFPGLVKISRGNNLAIA